jgi:TetR/AcrR family fatty acid metabolism transcriptional regulator
MIATNIAREAGVADGTIYLYFKSKDELLISLFESRMERVNTLLRTALEGLTSPRDKLLKFVETHLKMIADHRTLAEVLTIELRQSSKFMKEYSNPRFGDYLELLAGVIADGQEAGELSDAVPAQIAARAIFGMLDELALAWLLGGGEKFDIVRAAEWIGTMTLSGLERNRK